MALFENDGGPADVVNAFTDIHGDGPVMDALRAKMDREREAWITDEQKLLSAIAARVHETERVADDFTGMIPDFSVPDRHYHAYAFEFKLRAAAAGIEMPGEGYECWQDEEFQNWYKRKHPESVHKEAPRTATIVTPATKYGSVTARDTNRTSFTHGGLVAA